MMYFGVVVVVAGKCSGILGEHSDHLSCWLN